MLSVRVGMLASLLCAAIQATPVVIENVRVVDVRAGEILEERAVLIRDGRIESVVESGSETPAGAEAFDAGGLYLMPGLIDSHVHYMAPEITGRAMIASGVVLVRDMGGATAQVLALRDRLNAGEQFGPRMIATGAIVDGDPPVWPFSEACATPEAGREAVDRLADAGVDMIKVYSRLDAPTFSAVLERAAERGLMAVGHVPESVSLEEAARAGQRTGEHLMGVPSVVLPPMEPGDEGAFLGARDRWQEIADADDAYVDLRLAEMGGWGMVQCPTLVVMEGIARADDEDRAEHELMAYVPPMMSRFWEGPGYKRYAKAVEARVPIMTAFVGRMHRAGVPLIVGTDLANPYVFPGFSVHRELELFVEGGVPAPDALRAATIVPAELFGVDDRFGVIEPGREASFVLVRANPLEDIGATDEIESVWLAGERFDRAALDAMLTEARRRSGRVLEGED